MMETFEGLLQRGQSWLRDRKIDDWDLDAWYLFSASFSIDRAKYLLVRTQRIPENRSDDKQLFLDRIEQRGNHRPLQYILKQQEFMGLSFYVNERVLIPRQDTETLVEEILKRETNKDIQLADICTGSGCIAISLKQVGRYRRVLATDISAGALMVARRNSADNACKVEFFQCDLYQALEKQSCDVIVSNPPYIQSEEIDKLAEEVRIHEPRLALDGESDGLAYYRRLVNQGRDYLKPEGRVYLEIGYDQGGAVTALLEQAGFINIEIIKDLAGRDRVALACLGGKTDV